jgi:hypothetical protein
MEREVMTDVLSTVLDHIDNIIVPGEVFREPHNEYYALICLRAGLEFLYHQAAHFDEVVKQQVNPCDVLQFMGSGNLPEFNQIPKTLLICAFHWYAISACQYVRIVGAIAYRQDNSRLIPPQYVKTVIPEVLTFRNKVAAHFAWSTQHSQDNDAERLASILPPLVFINDSFHVGSLTVALQKSGKASTSNVIRPWSICKVHQKLHKRYWHSHEKPKTQDETT